MELDWKEICIKSGRSLDNTTVQALQRLDLNNFSSMSTLTVRNSIIHALPTMEPYSNRRSLAWDLAVVAKYKLPIFNSWIICFGNHPFKVNCRLPNKTLLSKEEVVKYYPNLLDINYAGDFVQLRLKIHTEFLVYMYSFSETESCSDISSQHYDLPVPTPSNNPISDNELSKTAPLGAGNAYIHMNKDATTAKYMPNGNIQMQFSPGAATFAGGEDERTDFLIDHLKSTLPSQYNNIKVSKVDKIKKKKNCTFCNFTGGGDLKVSQTGFQFLVMTCADTECGDYSPIDTHESRETLDMECKYSSTKTDGDVRIQLQANMYNLLVREYVDKLQKAPSLGELSHVLDLKKLSIYGISFGISRPLEVLKMTVNFSLSGHALSLSYEVKYENTTLLPKEALIDSCITAVLHRISKKSPSPDMVS